MSPNQAESLSIAAQLAALLARPVSVQERERACGHLLDWFGCAAAGTVSEAAAPLHAWAANAAPQECALLTGGAASLSAALIVNDPAIAALRAKVRVEEAARYTGAYPSHFGSSAYRELLKRKLGIETLVELVAPGELKAITGIDSRQKPVRLIDESRK